MKNDSSEQSAKVTERIDNSDKEKKQKRRKSNRRSKHNSGCVVEEVSDGTSKAKDCNFSSKQQQQSSVEFDDSSNEAIRASNVAFKSMPTSSGTPLAPCLEISKQLLSKSCPDPRDCEQSTRIDGELLQHKIFSSHWSLDALNKALEKGEAFKALFRVNAHNRCEAYCKIDGVPTDILINGNVGQNRAVEGDIVAIKLDPISLWPKMKGFVTEEANSPQRKGEKIAVDATESFDDEEGSCSAVEKLSTIITSFPNKRPTGQVVAIVENSLVRDSIVGLLDVKGWIHYKEGDTRRCKSLSDDEYVQMIPADPRFPKLIVPFHVLPESIKARLERIDPTLEAELVASQIVEWGEGSPFPLAHITHTFGRGSELDPQIDSILYQNSVCDSEFSPESLTSLPRAVSEQEIRRRKDLRDLCVLTIDPSTATDLDDALSVQCLPDGFFRVGVHIADVSYFVSPGTALDTEARFRSTSVYMPQRKIPMLPPLLSENVGSLNAGADRLAFSMLWDLDKEGNVIHRWIGRTVIRSCCKLSYDHAQDIIDGTDERPVVLHGSFEWKDVIESVKHLHEISTVLRRRRFENGALQLENTKPVFLFDENGVPYDFVVCSRKASNLLVEEFMLLANMTAAEVVSRAYPDSALLRRHPEPIARKLKEFQGFCSKHGMDLDVSSSRQFHESLEKITENLKHDSVFVDILNSYAIKPMQFASYFCTGDFKDNVDEWGHYALAVPLYTHFTSPLRRYADIVVHRAVAAALEAEVGCCFTGIRFDKAAAESMEGKEALSLAASKHGVPSAEILSEIAAHCNERKLAARRVKDACDKLYTWFVLKRKEVFTCEARVLNLGPRFMTVYISKLGIERRIYYDQVEGLCADWLEATSTLVLEKLYFKRGGRGYFKPLKEVVYLVSPCQEEEVTVTTPAVFPLTVRLFSTIPVVLHAVGGDDGPLDVGARLYMTSYYK